MSVKTAIITRFCYKEKLTQKRLSLFTENFISCMKSQTVKDFDVYVICEELYGETAHPENLQLIKSLNWEGLNVFFSAPEPFIYDIEVRLDSDDRVLDNFVEFLHSVAENNENILVSFKPIKVHKSVMYKHERDYSDNCGSMFLALIQRGVKNKGVYDRPHCAMAGYVGNVLTVKEGYCFLNIHDDNMTSKMIGKEIRL
jgi:hypothetical protein